MKKFKIEKKVKVPLRSVDKWVPLYSKMRKGDSIVMTRRESFEFANIVRLRFGPGKMITRFDHNSRSKKLHEKLRAVPREHNKKWSKAFDKWHESGEEYYRVWKL